MLFRRPLNICSCTPLARYLNLEGLKENHDYIRILSKCQVSVERIVLDLESEAVDDGEDETLTMWKKLE